MPKQIKIFIGVVPDLVLEQGSFNMIVVDRVNETKTEYPIIVGDNAKVLTVGENDMILFEHVGVPQSIVHENNVLDFVAKNIEKTLDTGDELSDNKP